MNKFVFIFFGFLVVGCQANEVLVNPESPDFENISFDVVQKQLVTEVELPNNLQMLVSKWFDQKVKVDGFDGVMKFTITEYLEEISSISDGKKVDVSLYFNIVLSKPNLSQTKMIKGHVSSYGSLTGSFSLAEFDTVIQNSQSDLVLRLSRDLKSKI